MHLPENLEAKLRGKERGIRGETLFHGKRARWGSIPPGGMQGERSETKIRGGPPVPFLGRREKEEVREEMNGYGGVGTPPARS